ncbi:MAG: DNA primase [Dehalococcoidales bacterium]|nr:DNA primase [Dehalococcoidales bacterium]
MGKDMSVIEEVKQRTDIAEVIGQFTKLTKAGKTYRGLCPFHTEKTPSFFVYPDQQSWHCFGACNTGGDVFSFIMKKQGIEFGEALRYLAERAGVTLPAYHEREGEKDEKERLLQINRTAAEYYHQLLKTPAAKQARDYLEERGLTAETMVKFQLGYAPDNWEVLKNYLMDKGYTEKELLQGGLINRSDTGNKTYDRFRHKIMFPICDIKGNVTGFGARVLDDSLPKYINSPQTPVFDKSGSLYGINNAAEAIRKADVAIFVEGYLDVIIPHQYGFNNVIASMGTSITERQISTVKRLTTNVALALDADAAGEEAMLRTVQYENLLNNEVKVVLLPEGKDPDEVIKEDAAVWQKLVAEAIPVVDFTIKTATAGLDLSKVKDKTVAEGKLLPVIAGINNDVRRDHYLEQLRLMTGSSYRGMQMALNKIKGGAKTGKVETETTKIVQSSLSNPVEEYLLSLLVQHPEIKDLAAELPAEYFESTENREIFLAWRNNQELELLKEQLDNSIREHLQYLVEKKIPASHLEQKYTDCSLRLREKYSRHLERKKAQVLALERETGGTDAELAKLEEQGISASATLRDVFAQRSLHQKG